MSTNNITSNLLNSSMFTLSNILMWFNTTTIINFVIVIKANIVLIIVLYFCLLVGSILFYLLYCSFYGAPSAIIHFHLHILHRPYISMCNVFSTVNKINLIFHSLNVIAYLYMELFFAFPLIYFSLNFFFRSCTQIDRNLANMIQFTICQVAAITSTLDCP